jgi:hypothetical protein
VYKRRILLSGSLILALSLLTGIYISFNKWDRGSPYDVSNWGKYNPLGRATYGTLAFALLLFPVTLPVLAVSIVAIYFGIKRQRLWPLSLLGFLAIGLLWVWYVVGVVNFD